MPPLVCKYLARNLHEFVIYLNNMIITVFPFHLQKFIFNSFLKSFSPHNQTSGSPPLSFSPFTLFVIFYKIRKWLNIGTVPTFNKYNVGTLPGPFLDNPLSNTVDAGWPCLQLLAFRPVCWRAIQQREQIKDLVCPPPPTCVYVTNHT